MRRVRKLRYLIGVTLAALAAMLILFASGNSVTEASTFTPAHSVNVADPTPNAVSNVTINTTFPSGGAMVSGQDNFTFLPPEWNVTGGAGVPDGSITAFTDALTHLGVFNSFCGAFPVPIADLPLIDATTDTSATVDFEDTGDPGSVGEVFEAPATDDRPIPNTPISIRKGVTLYPSWIADMFPAPIPDPVQRMWSYLDLGGNDIAINVVIWSPGDLSSIGIPGDKGYPISLFLNRVGDPLDPGNPSSAITDLCASFVASLTILGTTSPNPFAPAAPVTQLTNPKPGNYEFHDFFRSQRDADNDGIENSLDTCPVSFNADTTPRAFGTPINFVPLLGTGDPDGYIDLDFSGTPTAVDIGAPEGIDGACDADPSSACGPGPFDDFFVQDCDLDGYLNRSDNCPQVANGLIGGLIVLGVTQADTDGTIGSFMPDLGPLTDDIGDACDPNPTDPDGHYHLSGAGPICITAPVDTCGPLDDTGNSPAVVTSIPASLAALLPASAGGPITLPDDLFSTVNVTIGNHGVKLIRLQGASDLDGSGAQTYTIRVRNSSKTDADGFRVGLKIIVDTADCPVPSITGPAGTVVTSDATSVTASFDQAAGSVPALRNADVSFEVTYGTCTGFFTDTASDYRAVADACHRGDPSPRGLYAGGDCGSAIDPLGDNIAEDDAPKTKFVDDSTR